MTRRPSRNHNPAFKAKMALSAMKGKKVARLVAVTIMK